MFNLSEQSLEAYASWLADCADDELATTWCMHHAQNAGASDVDVEYILTRAKYLHLARTYGEGAA